MKICDKYTSEIIINNLLKDYNKEDLEKASDINNYYGNDAIAKDVLKNKYLAPEESSPLDMWVRVAWGCAQVEKDEDKLHWAKQYFDLLFDFKFVPGGRINYGMGRNDINVSFSNCYVLPIKEDSLTGIYNCIKEEAATYKRGGGCGHDLSNLRPSGAEIKGTGGTSCGPTGFMELFSVSTNTVAQQNRRGANMQTLLVSHPDIKKFINIKNDNKEITDILKKLSGMYPEHSDEYKKISNLIENKRSVQHSNISVKLTDDFLSAVENDETYNLTWGGELYETIKAKELWDMIVKNAWSSAEPGLIFWDRMKETNNLEYFNPILSTNPCSEIPLGAYGNCLLGHMNLVKFLKKEKSKYVFDFESFEKYVKIAMRFLDNVITLNNGRHALKEQNDIALQERRTGLGLTAVGDALIMMNLKYGSESSLNVIDAIGKKFRDTAYDSSCDLAIEKGSYPAFDINGFFQSKFVNNLPSYIQDKIKFKGIRNGMLLTIAPVGTGSIIAQTSSGIEPIFRASYIRKVKNDDAKSTKDYVVYHPLLEKLFNINNLSNMDDIVFPDYVVDSSQISPIDRVKLQAVIQKYIDNSISSTVNLPSSATEKDVSDVYLNSWKLGCKGITVYREGSREGVLISNDKKEQKVVKETTDRLVPRRPVKLSGETYKLKVDITGENPYNCYVTVNFEDGTRKPYELLVSETNSNKEMKDIASFEVTTRLVSLCLRHNVPIEFIVEQLEKTNGQYIYSLPVSIANVLKNYIGYEDINDALLDDKYFLLEKCPSCGEKSLKREGICANCLSCGYSKCS